MVKRNVYSAVKYCLLGFFLLGLLHFETISIGPVKISHLWKGVLVLFLLSATVKDFKIRIYLYGPLLMLALISLFNSEIYNNFVGALATFLLLLLLPLTGIYLVNLERSKIERLLLFLSSFTILSFVPYQLGLLSAIVDGYNLGTYGVKEVGLIGPFQKVHSASAVLALALLLQAYFFLTARYNRLYVSVLFFLGFYFLFYTYVRTGMAMVLVGGCVLVFYYGRKNFRTIFSLLFVSSICAVLVSTLVLSNETMVRRIMGERDHYSEDSIETVGSGRLLLAISTVDYYLEANTYEQLMGIGETEGLDRMKEKMGLRVFPHNGFLFLLSSTGFLGLLMFTVFLFKVYKLGADGQGDDSVLLKTLFAAYLTLVFLQSYDNFYTFIYLALSISLVRMNLVEQKMSGRGPIYKGNGRLQQG